MEPMTVNFVQHQNGPTRLIIDAEIIFTDGPLAGMKLVGFSLWRAADGETYVTFPSRSFGAGTERRYFDYIRSTEGLASDVKRVKDWILTAYREYERAHVLPGQRIAG